MKEDIKRNLEIIRERIDRAACGREITLVAVTKLHGVEEINDALECGVTDCGENKVQELLSKIDDVGSTNWHLIGHLQTNKVKQIIGKVKLIHSVDSLHLAQEIDKRAGAAGIVQDVLIQVNAAGEEQKSGAPAEEVPQLLSQMLELKNIRVQGLMQIAPFAEDPEDVRGYFRQVKRLYDDLKTPDFRYLSMGMSHDFEIAIEEGANMVRIGTAIFGARDYGKE
jgi:pyridoxal phosphate enzyme (YggS family)